MNKDFNKLNDNFSDKDIKAVSNNNIENFKEVYLSEEIPENIDKNIDDLLNNLPKQKVKRNNKRKVKVASIACAIFISMFILVINFESASAALMEFDIIKNTITAIAEKMGFSRAMTEGSEEHSENLDYIIEVNGDKININEVIFTPQSLTFTYVVSAEEYLGVTDIEKIEKMISLPEYQLMNVKKALINGEEVNIKKAVGYSAIDQDSRNIIGYQTILLENLKQGDKIKVATDSFEVEFTANINVTEEEVFSLKEPMIQSDDDYSIVVEELIQNPIFTYIVYTLELSEELNDDYNLFVDIVNENNRDMDKYQSYEGVREELSPNKVRISDFLINQRGGVEEIKIIPKLALNPKKDEYYKRKGVFVALDKIELPYIVDFGDLGQVIINSLEEVEDKVIINCDAEGVNKDTLLMNINIAPSKAEEILNDPNIVSNFNPIWMDSESYKALENLDEINNFILSFTKNNTDEEYSLYYNSGVKDVVLKDELCIKVK